MSTPNSQSKPFKFGKFTARSLNEAFKYSDTAPVSYAAAVAAIKASYTTALTGTNNDLKFEAKTAGVAGNAIDVVYVDPAANDQALSVAYASDTLTVNLATGPAGAITSTAAQIKAAVEASTPANAALAVTHAAGNDGSGVVTALAAQSLTGGAAATAEVQATTGFVIVGSAGVFIKKSDTTWVELTQEAL